MLKVSLTLIMLILAYKGRSRARVDWNRIKCSIDATDDDVTGTVPLHRYPWLGIVQHRLYIAEKERFAVTAGILIHPGYFLAPAEDMNRIPIEELANSTQFILWDTPNETYALALYDYSLPPEYIEKTTLATVAVVQLRDWASSRRSAPVKPVCVPTSGMGAFDNLFTIRVDYGTPSEIDIHKMIFPMNYVKETECFDFYKAAQLSYEKMSPTYPVCAAQQGQYKPCVWDSGAALVTRMDYRWTLLGFSAHGPGCGAPARYINMMRMMPWIEEAILSRPLEDLGPDERAFFFRRMSPLSLVLYPAGSMIPEEYGFCQSHERGHMVYNDHADIRAKYAKYAIGYYTLSVELLEMVTCMRLKIEATYGSQGTLWVEHSCHRHVEGEAQGMHDLGVDRRKMECFIYLKTTAFVEFRFAFYMRAKFYLTVYGAQMPERDRVLNPWRGPRPTDAWYPTFDKIRDQSFEPWYVSTRYL